MKNKKLCFVLFVSMCFILCICNIIYSDEFEFNYYAKFAFLPLSYFEMYDLDCNYITDIAFMTDLFFEIKLGCFFVRSNIITNMYLNSNLLNFNPESAYYNFGGGIIFKYIELGINHFCAHPIISYISQNYNFIWAGNYTEIYIKIKNK